MVPGKEINNSSGQVSRGANLNLQANLVRICPCQMNSNADKDWKCYECEHAY